MMRDGWMETFDFCFTPYRLRTAFKIFYFALYPGSGSRVAASSRCFVHLFRVAVNSTIDRRPILIEDKIVRRERRVPKSRSEFDASRVKRCNVNVEIARSKDLVEVAMRADPSLFRKSFQTTLTTVGCSQRRTRIAQTIPNRGEHRCSVCEQTRVSLAERSVWRYAPERACA